MIDVKLQDIVRAYSNIKPYVRNTPLIYSPETSERVKSEVWFKMESLQITGAFKLRGAINNIMFMSDEELKNGVVATSSGNHAQAVAYAAKLKNISAIVCVPESAPMSKREGILRHGAQLVVHGATYEEANNKAHEIQRETGRKFIDSYGTAETVAAQGTVGIESFFKKDDFDVVLIPTGGGGLLSGVAIVAKAINPDVKVYGLQTDTSAPWFNSFRAKKLDNDYPFSKTCADGLEGKIEWPNVELALKHVDDIIVVKERTTREGVKWMAEKHRYMIEGASATCLAALFEAGGRFEGKKVLCIITGGNIDFEKFYEICSHEY